MKTVWELKQAIDARLDLVKRGAKFKKSEWVEFLEEMSSDADRLEDRLHDDCYSADQIQDLAEERIEEHEREKIRRLRQNDAEENRQKFEVIEGDVA